MEGYGTVALVNAVWDMPGEDQGEPSNATIFINCMFVNILCLLILILLLIRINILLLLLLLLLLYDTTREEAGPVEVRHGGVLF